MIANAIPSTAHNANIIITNRILTFDIYAPQTQHDQTKTYHIDFIFVLGSICFGVAPELRGTALAHLEQFLVKMIRMQAFAH